MAIKVLIVDDSALIRKLLTRMLSADPDIDVVGTAPDPYIAREKIKALNPDVITLDIEMPRMDGLTFLANLMRLRPTPVVMVSTMTQNGARTSLEALHLGAVDYVSKPKADVQTTLDAYAEEIIEKVKTAATANVAALVRQVPVRRRSNGHAAGPRVRPRALGQRVIAIGASTGGTEAIAAVLAALPEDSPPVVIAQHIPEMFSRSFSERLDGLSALQVHEAQDGEALVPGHAYVAPGNYHLSVARSSLGFTCRLDQNPKVNRHRPSVDVLFDSVAGSVGASGIGVLLTGMGRDGARGLQAMRGAGARTLAQDKASSVVWGMPGAAVELDAVERVVALGRIAGEIVSCVSG
ncbi:MAG: chemotaxis response regulator protein-glutamate methylesterase [Pseudomonadales bacterium]